MKKISKKLLDELIEANREYWHVGNDGARCSNAANAIERATNISFYRSWDFVSSINSPCGFCPEADNETIYTALKVIGWEVVDE